MKILLVTTVTEVSPPFLGVHSLEKLRHKDLILRITI